MPVRLPRVLRHPDFRWLWLGQAASTIGDRMVTVALALFVTQLTGSATDLGVVLAAHALPFVALLLIGGVWADRLPRHRLMIATDVVRFALHALLAALILAGQVEIWQIVVIEVGFGAAEAFFRPAYSGLVPQTVPDDELQEANALSGASFNVAEMLGPVLATVLVLGVGAGYAFALDALTFLVSAGLLLLVRPRERGPASAPASLVAELRDGFREVRTRSWVWVTIAVYSFALLVALAPLFVLGAGVAERQYGSPAIYGVTIAAFGAGTVLGSLIGLRWRPLRPMRAGMIVGLLWPSCVVLLALGAAPALLLSVTVACGAGVALFEVWWLTALAERIPPHALSRVTAYDWMGSLGLLPLGYLLAGPLGDAFGPERVMLIGALLALVAGAVGLLPRQTRSLRRLERGAPAPGDRLAAP